MKYWIKTLILFMLNSVLGSNEDQLINDLLTDYNKKARPYPNGASKPVDIRIQMNLLTIDKLDEKKQHFQVQALLNLNWKDSRLTWNQSDYEEIKEIALATADVWVPDICLWNTVSDYFVSSHYEHVLVRIMNDGSVGWEPGGTYDSICQINIKYFPFDDQVCMLQFGSWAYSGNNVNVSIASNKPDVSLYLEHNELEMVNTFAARRESKYPCCPETYTIATFTFHLRRKPLYFIVNIIIPSVMLTILVLLVFLLPPESGEKITLGVTSLVTYTLFMLMISESVPRSSDSVPLIVVYLMFFMGCATMGIVISVLVLHLHHKSGDTPPPNWIINLTNYICLLLRWQKVMNSETNQGRSKERINATGEDYEILRKLIEIESRLNQMNETNARAEQWKKIAEILNRFSLLVFGLLVVFFSGIILGLVPTLRPEINVKDFSIQY